MILLSYLDLLLGVALILLLALSILGLQLNLTGQLFFSALRTTVQLGILGYLRTKILLIEPWIIRSCIAI